LDSQTKRLQSEIDFNIQVFNTVAAALCTRRKVAGDSITAAKAVAITPAITDGMEVRVAAEHLRHVAFAAIAMSTFDGRTGRTGGLWISPLAEFLLDIGCGHAAKIEASDHRKPSPPSILKEK
jgi:hypothetical protein